MNTIVIYPGRFHPFHRGHKASYDWLVKHFGDGVYIATSNVQNDTDSPFSYSDKVKMMTKLGIPSDHIVQVKNPYQAREIVDSLTPEQKADTALVFAVSEKDSRRRTSGRVITLPELGLAPGRRPIFKIGHQNP